MRQAIPFGKYLLLDRISVGGMAEVFRAKSYGVEGFEKVIAIKRILPSMGEDRDFIKMFIDEAKIAGQLAHANICQIFELGRTEGAHFIAMEFIWGKDLLQMQNRLRKMKQPMPASLACFVVGKVCEGLDYAHRKRDPMGRPLEIVHRDCSPQNVIVSYEGEVKIIDFGIAKAASRSSRTMHGVLKGKFGYMSPEQVRGLPLDRRSDVFALGTILYECLTGDRLFQGDTDFATLEKVRNVDIAPPRQVNPTIPAEVERIIMKALARDVENRYQWCSELLADLQAYLMSQPQVFTAKSLATFMKECFAPELDKERQQLESYKKIGREGLIAGVPQAQAKLDVVEHLGEAGAPEGEATVLGGPSFDDIVGDGATQISDMSEVGPTVMDVGGNPNVATAGEVAAPPRRARDNGDEEGPTTIFGDDVPAPLPSIPPVAPRIPTPPPRTTAQSPAVPVPRMGSVPAPAPPPLAPTATPPARTLYGMPAPVVAAPQQSLAAGTGSRPGSFSPPPTPAPAPQYTPPQQPAYDPAQYAQQQQAYAQQVYAQQSYAQPQAYPVFAPVAAAPTDKTQLGLDSSTLPVEQLVAQAQAELARARAENATVMGGQAPPLPLQPGPPSGAVPAAMSYGYDPNAQWQQQPAPPLHDLAAQQAAMQPSFTPSGVLISPPTSPFEPVAAVTQSGQRRKSSLGKDIAIGVAIAAVVLGAVAIVKFVVLGDSGGARSAAAAATGGTIEVHMTDNAPADVSIGGTARGSAKDGTLSVADVAVGSAKVEVARDGVTLCTQTVEVAAGETASVECKPPPAAAVAPPPPSIDAGVAVAAVTLPDAAAPAVAPPPVDAAAAVAVVTPPDAAAAAVAVKPVPPPPAPDAGVAAVAVNNPPPPVEEHHHHDHTTTEVKPKDTAKDPKHTTQKPPPPPPAATEGYLVAYTTPWAKVLVDGHDTGKMTPIAPRAKINLPPGKHKVTFVVGKESWSYPFVVTVGETTKITKDLPVAPE